MALLELVCNPGRNVVHIPSRRSLFQKGPWEEMQILDEESRMAVCAELQLRGFESHPLRHFPHCVFYQLGRAFCLCTRFVPSCTGSCFHAFRISASSCSCLDRTQGL